MNFLKTRSGWTNLAKIGLVVITGLLLILWLMNTPAGLLGKADAVGYAICHRIPERSFLIGDRPTPLCARCSGMQLGALLGFIYQLRLGKRGGMPAVKISVVLGFFLLAFAVDGLNSYIQFFPNSPALYAPQNWLRLATGTGIGIGIAALLYPVFNQTLWADYSRQPALSTWKQLGHLLLLAAILDLVILSQNPLALYPLALLSALSVLSILTLVYSIIWALVLRLENRYETPRQAWALLLAGFAAALAQISLMDAARFALTGSWNGFLLN